MTPAEHKTRWRREGICVNCGKAPAAEDRMRCLACLGRHATRMRALRQQRLEAGLCPHCGQPLVQAKRHCQACRAKERAWEAEHRRPSALPAGLRPPTAYRQAQVDCISRYIGFRRPEWIGKRLRISARRVVNICAQEGIGPTCRTDLLTTGHVADILGCSQQWVAALCRSGRMRAWRNPGGRWWLIPVSEAKRWAQRMQQGESDPRLAPESGWPRAVSGRIRRRNVRVAAI